MPTLDLHSTDSFESLGGFLHRRWVTLECNSQISHVERSFFFCRGMPHIKMNDVRTFGQYLLFHAKQSTSLYDWAWCRWSRRPLGDLIRVGPPTFEGCIVKCEVSVVLQSWHSTAVAMSDFEVRWCSDHIRWCTRGEVSLSCVKWSSGFPIWRRNSLGLILKKVPSLCFEGNLYSIASYGNPCFLFSARVGNLQAESRHNAADGVEQRDLQALIVGRS